MKLKAQNLIKIYNERKVVNDVSLEVSLGEVVGLLGPNGAGKTTTFYMIAGLEYPEQGNVYIENKKITKYSLTERAKIGISYLAQEKSIFQKLSVKNNLILILEMLNLTKKEQKNRFQEVVNYFHIEHLLEYKGIQLSGGERRRVEIARALLTKPNFILLDEPFAGVDPISVQDIQNIIKKLKSINLGILITDHNVRETLAIIDKAYLMNRGEILIFGNSEEISKNPLAKKFYLGEEFKL